MEGSTPPTTATTTAVPQRIKLFLGQLPTVTEAEIREAFSPFGDILEIYIMKDKVTGTHKACGFITFSKKEEGDAAIEALHNKMVFPNSKNPLQVRLADGEHEKFEVKLFMGQIPRDKTDEQIKALLVQYGEVKDFNMLKGPGGVSKGCCFVRYASRDQAEAAIAGLNNYRLDTAQPLASGLVVKYADNDNQRLQRKIQKQFAMPFGGQPVVYVAPMPYGANYAYPYPYQQAGRPVVQPYVQPQGAYPQPAAVAFPQPQAQAVTHTQPPPSTLVPYYPPGILPPQQPPQTGTQQDTSQTTSPSRNTFSQQQQGYTQPHSGYVQQPPQAQTHQPPHAQPVSYYYPQPAQHNPQAIGARAEGPPGANLFIFHAPVFWTDTDLYNAFAPFGTILGCQLATDKVTGQAKCYGFVNYERPESAAQAVGVMDGFTIAGKKLSVSLKKAKGSAPY